MTTANDYKSFSILPADVEACVYADRWYSITDLHVTVHPPQPPVRHLLGSSLHHSVIL